MEGVARGIGRASFPDAEHSMRAADVMTRHVLRIRPDWRVERIAETLARRQISALPVVDDDGRVVGIVTEGDLVRRPEIGTARPPADDPDSFAERTSRAAAYAKSHGLTAADIMTRDVVTVAEGTPVAEIAELMERRRIKRVPVVEDDRLVGLVSRLDLVRAIYLQGLREPRAPLADAEIEAALEAEIAHQGWKLAPGSKIAAAEGVVHLWGAITSTAERRALTAAAKALPGVRAVEDHLEIAEPRIEFI
jgi:CBS domain-containing protein